MIAGEEHSDSAQAIADSFNVMFFFENRYVAAASYTATQADEISFEVGFSHPTYFTTMFGKAYGLSPREYRAKHQ